MIDRAAAPLGRLVVLVGPAGAGKTTLAHRLIAAAPARRAFSVSHTTRPIRASERDGVDYHFVDRQAFESKIAAGAMVEWAEVHGNLYGTSHAAIADHLAAGRDVLFDVDIQGATRLWQAFPGQTRLVFILPPSWQALVARLQARGSESDATLRRRLRTARFELAEVLAQLDAGVPWDLVVNDDLDVATAALERALAAEPAPPAVAASARIAAMADAARGDPLAADPIAAP